MLVVDKIKQVKSIYHSHNLDFYVSLLGPFAMGSLHLVSILIHFDWIAFNYCLFSYLMLLFKVWQWAIEKYNLKPRAYMAGIISMILVIAPMMASFILTILYRDAPQYIFYWIVYAYALYGTIKMTMAIIKISKKRANRTPREYVITWLGLISAAYTIQMMEFRLIKFVDGASSTESMYLMQLFTQGAIFIFALIVIYLFVRKYLSYKKAVRF